MKLIRLAIVKFSNAIDERYKSLEGNVKAVKIRTYSLINNTEAVESFFPILVTGQVGFEKLPNLSNGLIELPEYPRKIVEATIETLSNYISVSTRTEKTICSSFPYVILLPETETESDLLSVANGISVKQEGRVYPELTLPFNSALLDYLTDRLDGLALLAESINQKHPVGKFREFVRFFERAFKLGTPEQLTHKVAQFLIQSPFGYTKDEVKMWFDLRHPAIHADRNKEFVLERDVQLIVRRMEQAAYEVLFNKLKWNDNSRERRQIYQPLSATTSKEESGGTVVAGSTVQFRHLFFDGFGSYQMCDGLNLSVEQLVNVWSNGWIPPNLKPPET